MTFPIHRNNVLLVLGGAGLAHRVQKLAAPVADISNGPRDGGAVDVDVKNAQEDADSRPLAAIHHDGGNVGYFTVCRGDDRALGLRDHPFRISEEPQKESRQQETWHSPSRTGQPISTAASSKKAA
jgi:hypothetical protein